MLSYGKRFRESDPFYTHHKDTNTKYARSNDQGYIPVSKDTKVDFAITSEVLIERGYAPKSM